MRHEVGRSRAEICDLGQPGVGPRVDWIGLDRRGLAKHGSELHGTVRGGETFVAEQITEVVRVASRCAVRSGVAWVSVSVVMCGATRVMWFGAVWDGPAELGLGA